MVGAHEVDAEGAGLGGNEEDLHGLCRPSKGGGGAARKGV